MAKKFLFAGFLILFLLYPKIPFLKADDYSSTDFILRDPVITVEGGASTSPDFQYFSATGQAVAGENTSASFILRSGFLYFPFASSPVISATAGDAQVTVNWTASVGTLANITNYQLGIATAINGPYIFQNVGNTLSDIETGLTNGVTYYFEVRAFANTLQLAQSGETNAEPVASNNNNNGGGGGGAGAGGGGSGSGAASFAQVTFSGRAYPLSTVTILEDGQTAVTTIADPAANFNVSLSGLATGNYTFSVYGTDSAGRRSDMFTFPTFVTQGSTTNIGGIFIAPTIAVDKSEVKQGDNIAIFGQSVPNAQVTISVHSQNEIFAQTPADKNGIYLYNLDTAPLELGQHATQSKATLASQITNFGQTVNFTVGNQNISTGSKVCPLKGDLNGDCKVNLVDFSIASYWYSRTLSSAFKKVECSELNCDGKINLVDFSIMAYYWTG